MSAFDFVTDNVIEPMRRVARGLLTLVCIVFCLICYPIFGAVFLGLFFGGPGVILGLPVGLVTYILLVWPSKEPVDRTVVRGRDKNTNHIQGK